VRLGLGVVPEARVSVHGRLAWPPAGACLPPAVFLNKLAWPPAGGPSRWLFRGPGHRQEGVRAMAADKRGGGTGASGVGA